MPGAGEAVSGGGLSVVAGEAPSPSAEALGAGGPFDTGFPGFRPRVSQQEMAARVEQAIAGRSILVAESGTGTGKTFAYLVPVLLGGGRVIVSTGTRHLQDQLYLRDLPAVRDALGTPCRAERLKGRANYLCLHRLEYADEITFHSRDDARDLGRIRSWAATTRSGDISELEGVADDSAVWGRVVSSADNCLGSRCDYIQDCHVYRARKQAMAADVVVVNHHLFFSDIALKDEGFGEVLPDYDAVVFDEAHLIPEVAAQFFGFSFGTSGLRGLLRDVRLAEVADRSGVDLEAPLARVERAINDLAALVPAERRGEFDELGRIDGFEDGCDSLLDAVRELDAGLERAAVAGESLALARERCAAQVIDFERFRRRDGQDMVYWYDSGKRSLRFQATPISVSGLLGERLFGQGAALVFTSATLSSGDRGEHFRQSLGMPEAETRIWDSPYDYREHALAYFPDAMPQPSDPRYVATMLERILPVLRAAGGRAFVLFTSYRAMNEARELLDAAGEFNLLVQGESPRQLLVERFRNADRAVLLGTGSFWEGVDVKGEDLVVVVIDKLPFASPADPVNRARIRHIDAAGGNAFVDYQLPRAVLALKQGAGRLIRDEQDYGVLVICDPRLRTRSYGTLFLDALPPMRRTTRQEVAVRFLEHHRARSGDR